MHFYLNFLNLLMQKRSSAEQLPDVKITVLRKDEG